MLFSACTAGIFLSYLTNAAFIYMQYFRLNEFQFSAAFAAGGLTMITGNRIAVKLMGVYSPVRVLSVLNGLHICAVAVAVVCSLLLSQNLWAIMGILLVTVGIGGANAPSAAGFYMGLFKDNVGSAASLSATMMFAIGSLFGASAALVSGGSLTPIFLVMLAAGFLARMVLPRELG